MEIRIFSAHHRRIKGKLGVWLRGNQIIVDSIEKIAYIFDHAQTDYR